MCEDFLGGGLTVLSTPVQMFSVTQCDYRSFCAYAVSFGMVWRSIETQRLVFLEKIPQAEQKHFALCGYCFARFISSYVNNEMQWHQRCLFIALYSARNHLFLRKFQKSLQVQRNEHILKSEIYLITCKLSQKTDPIRGKTTVLTRFSEWKKTSTVYFFPWKWVLFFSG